MEFEPQQFPACRDLATKGVKCPGLREKDDPVEAMPQARYGVIQL